MSQQAYKIIWKHFEKSSSIGKHLNAKEDFSLPYFIDGEEMEKFEKQEAVSLNHIHLVRGLLVGYFDKPPKVDTSFAQSKATEIIMEQLPNFGTASLESLILDLSTYLRDTFGELTSMQSLLTGVELVPESAAIKYDGCIDLINCIDDNQLEDRLAGVQQLKILLSKIDVKGLNPELVNDYHQMLNIANEF
jgi:hypothetical protein